MARETAAGPTTRTDAGEGPRAVAARAALHALATLLRPTVPVPAATGPAGVPASDAEPLGTRGRTGGSGSTGIVGAAEAGTTGDRLDEIVGALIALERLASAVAATRVRLLDDARRWAVAHPHALTVAVESGAPTAAAEEEQLARRAVVAELGCALRVPERTMNAAVDEAQVLVHEPPTTLDALADGAITHRHAQVMVDETVGLAPALVPALEAQALPAARLFTVATFRRRARRIRDRLDPRSLDDRHERASSRRCVDLVPVRDGMATLSHYLPAAQAHAIDHRITDIARRLQSPTEHRTLTQLRSDVLTCLLLDVPEARTPAPGRSPASLIPAPPPPRSTPTALGTPTMLGAPTDPGTSTDPRAPIYPRAPTDSAPDGDHPLPDDERLRPGIAADEIPWTLPRALRSIRPTVMVTVPVLTLLGHSDEPAHLHGHGPIDATTARLLTANAPSLVRLLTHPEDGTVLSVGRQRYTVPADLRTYLRLRDETCRFPGCSRRAEASELDHTIAWADGGTTSSDNLAHLCPAHHHLKHETSWRVRQEQGGSLVWTSPTGRLYRSSPAAPLAGADPRVQAIARGTEDPRAEGTEDSRANGTVSERADRAQDLAAPGSRPGPDADVTGRPEVAHLVRTRQNAAGPGHVHKTNSGRTPAQRSRHVPPTGGMAAVNTR